MKKTALFFWPCFAFILLFQLQASAALFTSNTDINPVNTQYDGQDIIISNCVVTIDGAHTFESLVVATNGTLTHSFSPNGTVTTLVNTANESHVLSGTTPVLLSNSNIVSALLVTDSGQTTTYTFGVDYEEITNQPGTAIEIERTSNSSIPNGATVLVSYSWDDFTPAGLNLTISGPFTVALGGFVNGNTIGYGPANGPGTGASSSGAYFDGSGGGDGGNGGMSGSNAFGGGCYDSLYQPASLGSGGGTSYAGNGGNGGGLIQIVANGNIDIEGVVSANGGNAANSRAGGGSGGGIYLSAANFSGAGSISANGGAGAPVYGGGGGGGHIAIVSGANSFSGSMTAYGGSGSTYGGAGTIFTQLTGQTGLLVVNNGGNTGTNSTISLPTNADVFISGNAAVVPGSQFSPRNLTIGTNSLLSWSGTGIPANLIVSNLIVQAGGIASVNGVGSTSLGAGGISSGYGGGGGHGGAGGYGPQSIINATGGSAFDTPTSPTYPGGHGGGDNVLSFGGAGGGIISLEVSGTLQVNGQISANGLNGSGFAGGGGAGGTILVNAGLLSGSGALAANGANGAASLGGGGGGGCIAMNLATNMFAGSITCYGGSGANNGGAGTVYTLVSGGQGQLVLDDGGNSPGPLAGGTPLPPGSSINAIIQNGAIALVANGIVYLNSLLVASNSVLTAGNATFNITSNATFLAGSQLNANSQGFAANVGESSGDAGGYQTISPYFGAGGGNAGVGGNSLSNNAAGGHAGYNQVSQPQYPGSGGGGFSPYSIGGNGGGYVPMTIGGTLLLNGVISANGGNGFGVAGGGGSGGSIYLSVGTITGVGAITANGGAGASSEGGGGGGGCIAIAFKTNLFNGALSAYGGSGGNYGGAGTIYFRTNSTEDASLIVDNGGHAGAGTAIQSSYTQDLTVRSNGVVGVSGEISFANITVGSNSMMLASSYPLQITANNVAIQAGGGLIADTNGYSANNGPDEGRDSFLAPYYPGSGAGNGGYGGASISNILGSGAALGATANPTIPGSGGGGDAPYSFGGNGGGVIELNASGTLQVNGTLSANGGNGSGDGGGGGAGGSLELAVGSLTGSGVIAANGGGGASSIGGGGGGGMIAITFQGSSVNISNLFRGAVTAYGGGGASYGGAGTVYFKTNSYSQGLLIIDNGGNRGTNTPISISGGYTLLLRNGAIGFPASGGLSLVSFLITSNAWMVPEISNPGTLILNLASGTSVIQPGGGIIADGYGYTQNGGSGHGAGIGTSPYYPCSGAGHGGDGAFGLFNGVAGGATYDTSSSPANPGSGGGGFSSYSTGGAGGGSITLNTGGSALVVNGIISANGLNGSGSGGGGGSGGAIYLNTAAISGTGVITANGGNGALGYGGGGGGGRIALYASFLPVTNVFTGTLSAYGGGGASYGGAGTIYFQTNQQDVALLLLDNGGNVGTNTTFTYSSINVTVQNGAIGQLPVAESWSPDNVFILSNSAMVGLAPNVQPILNPLNLTIASGGVLSLDGCGYYNSQGGAGAGNNAGGAGHGGYGGGNPSGGGQAYDSIQAPVSQGSAGANSKSGSAAGGSGGGELTMNVSGTLTVNGRLSANGIAGAQNAGAGAGGSLYLENIRILAGNGVISANGGAGLGTGGSGGGGRIALYCTTNKFSGQISAIGGSGVYPGGAGTVFTSISNNQVLAINNGGIAGTNTPLGTSFSIPVTPFELDISGAASVVPLSPLPLLSNLTVAASSTLTLPAPETSFLIGVLKNATIAGSLNVDRLGYPQTNGPGAGITINNDGSGGGYGGIGGASSSSAPGGLAYGSAAEPIAFGSGGGNGAATTTGGSDGGGALRLSVSGQLNVSGNISANGNAGLQDNSGGGSGGSVWITAGSLSGTGNISVLGGNGVLFGGGGGGGGRIAIYTATNNFTGTTNVNGGTGSSSGQPGTVYLSSVLPGFQILGQSPTGMVMNTVSSVNLTLSDMLNPASISSSDFTLITPSGALPASAIAAVANGPFQVQLSFPPQNLIGTYTIQAANLTNLFGTPLTGPYSGTFTVSLPTISGTVLGTNGVPVSGVLLQPNGGLTGVTTDVNGNYALGIPPGWNGTVTPSLGNYMFVPDSLSYTNVIGSLTNQDYLIVSTVSPSISTTTTNGDLSMNWTGIPGVTYQLLWSTNLVTWQPLGSPLVGSNGLMQIMVPLGSNSDAFFQLNASY